MRKLLTALAVTVASLGVTTTTAHAAYPPDSVGTLTATQRACGFRRLDDSTVKIEYRLVDVNYTVTSPDVTLVMIGGDETVNLGEARIGSNTLNLEFLGKNGLMSNYNTITFALKWGGRLYASQSVVCARPGEPSNIDQRRPITPGGTLPAETNGATRASNGDSPAPVTGSETTWLAGGAFALSVLGVALVTVSRRRNPATRSA